MGSSHKNGTKPSAAHAFARVLGSVGVCCALLSGQAVAQSSGEDGEEGEVPLGPGLVGGSLQYANGVERAAAAANDLVYRTLSPDCNPFGVLDRIPTPSFGDLAELQVEPGPLCNEDTFFVYLNSRELAHTANELQGQGPTSASLGVDQEGLGTALRWTAAEELAAQGSMATEFANGQLSTLAARLNALRFGAGGFRTAGMYDWLRRTSPMVAQANQDQAVPPADGPGETYSPWGGFVNYGFGYGSREPTALEDAFDFDGSEVTFGVDYRLRNNVVLGGIIGRSRQNIDFDEAASTISVVDGNIESDGDSFMFFALSQGERMTISGSIGTQSLDYEVKRDIKYPSFNPDVPSVYSVAKSRPEAHSTLTTFGFAYAFTFNKLVVEPYMNAEHLKVDIGAFAEERSINLLSDTNVSRRFDLVVSEQQIESLRTSVGLRFQYVLTPRLGVIVPYWSIAAHEEHEDEARTITTGYAALADVLGDTTFTLATDPPDSSYLTASAGFSMIIRGGRQRQIDGPIAGGLTAFLQIATIENRRYYEDRVVTGGLRYEF